MRGLAARIQLSLRGQRLNRMPDNKTAARCDVLLDDLLNAQVCRRSRGGGHRRQRQQAGSEEWNTWNHGYSPFDRLGVHSTTSPSAWNFPIITFTRSPRRTRLPLLEKTIQ